MLGGLREAAKEAKEQHRIRATEGGKWQYRNGVSRQAHDAFFLFNELWRNDHKNWEREREREKKNVVVYIPTT